MSENSAFWLTLPSTPRPATINAVCSILYWVVQTIYLNHINFSLFYKSLGKLKSFKFQWGLSFHAPSWFWWHLRTQNAFYSICFPKSSHPFRGSLFALHTSVSISGLAGATLNSSVGTSASSSHLCPGPLNPPVSVKLSLGCHFLVHCINTTLNTSTSSCSVYIGHTRDLWRLVKRCTSLAESVCGCRFVSEWDIQSPVL